jgi:hypothetical protein
MTSLMLLRILLAFVLAEPGRSADPLWSFDTRG